MYLVKVLKTTIARYPMPFGLMSPYGKVYGWKLHEKKNFPEQETFDFFEKRLGKDDVVADIGANIGLYTLFFSRLTQRVFAFEPSGKAYARLVRAIRTNYVANATPLRKGIFSRKDTLKLYYQIKGDPMGSVMYTRGTHYEEVPVVPLSDIEEEYGVHFTWAKIDAEGAEIEVLRGMRPLKAVLEVARGILETHGQGVEHFFKEIESLGYTIYFIVDGGNIVAWDGTNMKSLKNNIYIEPVV